MGGGEKGGKREKYRQNRARVRPAQIRAERLSKILINYTRTTHKSANEIVIVNN